MLSLVESVRLISLQPIDQQYNYVHVIAYKYILRYCPKLFLLCTSKFAVCMYKINELNVRCKFSSITNKINIVKQTFIINCIYVVYIVTCSKEGQEY